jgi:hypothetical protein
MRMVARRRKHKDGCREGEGEDLRMVARRPINYVEDCMYTGSIMLKDCMSKAWVKKLKLGKILYCSGISIACPTDLKDPFCLDSQLELLTR